MSVGLLYVLFAFAEGSHDLSACQIPVCEFADPELQTVCVGNPVHYVLVDERDDGLVAE